MRHLHSVSSRVARDVFEAILRYKDARGVSLSKATCELIKVALKIQLGAEAEQVMSALRAVTGDPVRKRAAS